jgi:hypothetical protein
MKREELFPSKYLKCGDLKGRSVVVEIEEAPLEQLKGTDGTVQSKVVLHFVGKRKSMPLNRTNWDSVVEVTGEDDTVNWPGCRIEIYPSTTEMAGKRMDCIRVRAPASKEGAAPKQRGSSEDAFDDEIPF